MATAHKPKNWTSKHEDALSGLTGLGLNKKYAASLLENIPAGELSDMMNAALRSHAKSKKLTSVPGGPKGAAPINPPVSPAQTKPGINLRSFVPKPPQIAATGPAAAPQLPRINLRAFTPQPSSPAIAQLSVPSMAATNAPDRPAMPGPGAIVKPRIRVRAAGGPVPAAPLGAAAPSIEQGAPTNAPVTPTAGQQPPSTQEAAPPRIRSEEEYEKLPPGVRFVWIPDGHIYRKPAEGG